jgi:hypothetical protein
MTATDGERANEPERLRRNGSSSKLPATPHPVNA